MHRTEHNAICSTCASFAMPLCMHTYNCSEHCFAIFGIVLLVYNSKFAATLESLSHRASPKYQPIAIVVLQTASGDIVR